MSGRNNGGQTGSAAGAWECDLATGRLTWSDPVYDLFGLPRGSAIDRARTLALYEEDSRAVMEQLRAEAIRHRGCFTLDATIRTADGARRWMRLAADVEFEGDRPVRLFGTKQDVTAEYEMKA